ncbi:MAG: formate/nitrite transporter family protein [Coriobacteriales bacterium]|jgi:formate/nitrite transporter|nr:formate/nitrite transporter family protein [Coriobacteriales bacterium]
MDAKDLKTLKPDALSPAEIAGKAEDVGAVKAQMPLGQTFLLAVMAGIFIGFGGMFMLLIKSDAALSPAVAAILGGLAFCTGLFLVITAGAELFTGNALMMVGRLSRRFSWRGMLRNWVVVYLGNFAGALLLVALLFFADYAQTNTGALGATMLTVAAGKIGQPWSVLLFKGIMCNFLVCLAVWVAYAARTVTDKFFAILLPITAFVACGFEHCVANMFFLPMGWLTGQAGQGLVADGATLPVVELSGVFYNLSIVTVGNIIGGALFVGVAYWLIYRREGRKGGGS